MAGVTDYLVRTYEHPDDPENSWLSLYVGYYDQQMQGQTIHSPRNCLPGGGWEPVASRTEALETASGPVQVHRYLIQKGSQQAVVLYWYQGRGRVAANEYRVKWDLLRDAALNGRTEEALVRIVVPVRAQADQATALARTATVALVRALWSTLPG